MAYADRLPLIKKIEQLRGSKVVCYLTSLRQGSPGTMNKDATRELFDQLLALPEKPVEKLDLFLCSDGGDSILPWRLVPVFREFAKSFAVLVPYHAFSAATILSLGANEIVMHPFATLGPIEPTVMNEFNPMSPNGRVAGINVEDVKAYLNFVKTTAGITHQDQLVQMLSILAEKVHPLALGNVERFLSQCRLIARKLLNTHVENLSQRDIDDAIENLVSKFYFHGHPINRIEARELHLPVVQNLSVDLESAIWDLYADFEKEFQNRDPFQPFAELCNQIAPFAVAQPGITIAPQIASKTYEIPLAIVESRTFTAIQKCKKRFTLICEFGRQDQLREELMGMSWSKIRAQETEQTDE